MERHSRYKLRTRAGWILFATCFFASCTNKTETEELRDFKKKIITIPTKQLIRKSCYLFSSDSLQLQAINIVHYIKNHNCVDCIAENVSVMENIESDKKKMLQTCNVFIISTVPQHEDEIYKKLCGKRIKGIVYLDTCDAFITANPSFPDNYLFHLNSATLL